MRNLIRKSLLKIIVLAIWGVFLLPLNNAQTRPEGVLKEAIHWGISADWLDPATGSLPLSAYLPLYLFHDALLKPMPDGLYAASLAESWKISPDSKVYEFKLRQGVKFHNGDTMTAEDVVFSFWRYKAANAKIIQDRAEKVEAVNPYLVRIQFKEPFPDFLEYLLPGVSCIGWVVPKKYVEKVGDSGFKRHPVGCGPYKFVEFSAGIKLVGEAFEDFWRKVPHVKRMEFYSIPEAATRLAMVKRGEVDIATLMQGVFYEDMRKDPKLRMFLPMSATRWLVEMTSQWNPNSPWANLKVRQAASLAIDRQTLADVHMPGCKGIGDLGLPGDPNRLEIPPDPYVPEKARKLLAEVGYPNGFQGGLFYPYEGGYWPMGEQVATYWKAIGIDVETRLLDRPAWLAQRVGLKMTNALFVDTQVAPTIGGRLSYLFGSASYGNYPDIQRVWEKYKNATDPKGRKELIIQVQRMIHDRMMFIPLVDTNSPAAFGPKVKGNPYKIQPLIWFTSPFEDIELVQ